MQNASLLSLSNQVLFGYCLCFVVSQLFVLMSSILFRFKSYQNQWFMHNRDFDMLSIFCEWNDAMIMMLFVELWYSLWRIQRNQTGEVIYMPSLCLPSPFCRLLCCINTFWELWLSEWGSDQLYVHLSTTRYCFCYVPVNVKVLH